MFPSLSLLKQKVSSGESSGLCRAHLIWTLPLTTCNVSKSELLHLQTEILIATWQSYCEEETDEGQLILGGKIWDDCFGPH